MKKENKALPKNLRVFFNKLIKAIILKALTALPAITIGTIPATEN